MNPQLTTRLRHLRLSGMVEALPGRVAQAEAAPLAASRVSRTARRGRARAARRPALRAAPQTSRHHRRSRRSPTSTGPSIRRSRRPRSSNWPAPASSQTHAGVLLIGPPGVGKSHVATAIAVGAIRAGRRALVRSTFDLAADFAAGRGDRRPPRARAAAHARRPARARRLRHEEARRERGRGSPGGLRASARNGVDADHDESTDAGLGRLPRRRPRRHRDPRSLPRARRPSSR